ncbi:hypothetical protein HYH96_18160 [Clostridium botulinum]|uniref:Uncharacterized protein n=1 Tax=Clostridium botulinum (strain Okra / Type B1) TaxID=498213 RepID=B1INM1_CLOBK|nr:hypothetical protein [Clostridium botulinum]ACA46953.1 hypothetical protein CLD_A0044 [Clostridium botulinum B1 str. Okra]MBD5580953.1 hypothetical protein [Clostridium botulinum]MBD5625396.1 hypothetical protein [Clostridium botulinum]MBD5631304.1 hypothetical protein [Clostridium botulinum]MBD5645799.1 hypothetical protein [Clostridium botulinum]
MRLEKSNGKHGGYYITLYIGTKENTSFFEAPSESIDHAGIEYIQGRYPMIGTKAKEETFKRLYKNLFIKTTEYQDRIIKHCIGLDYKKKPYRNRYETQSKDEDWNDLVKKGLATMSNNIADNGLTWFWLTQQGVEYVLGKSVSQKVYEEL